MIVEIAQQIWFETPKGKGVAKFMIDRGDEGDTQWVIFLENGEVWTFSNWDVRLVKNVTMGRE